MRRLIKFIFTIGLVLGLILKFYSQSFALDDAIIAVVNNDVITFQDLQNYIKSVYLELSTEKMPAAQLKEIMNDLKINGINKLIEDKLILAEANRTGIEIRPKLIDERLDKIKQGYPSEQVFLNALVEHGGTVTELRKKIEDQLKIKYIIELQVRSKIFVNPQEVTEYYEKNISQFRKKERVNLDSIYIAFTEKKEEARQKAQAALKEIQNGNFRDATKKYSQAPSIGTVERGQLLPVIEDAIFSLKEGQVSAPIEVETGIYIFKLNGKILPEVAALQDVKEDISNLIFQEKFKNQFNLWLDKIKKRAYIEIKQ